MNLLINVVANLTGLYGAEEQFTEDQLQNLLLSFNHHPEVTMYIQAIIGKLKENQAFKKKKKRVLKGLFTAVTISSNMSPNWRINYELGLPDQ